MPPWLVVVVLVSVQNWRYLASSIPKTPSSSPVPKKEVGSNVYKICVSKSFKVTGNDTTTHGSLACMAYTI